jgi:hypothetical protein
MCAQMAQDPEMIEMMKDPAAMKAMCQEMAKNNKAKAICMKMMKERETTNL